MCCQGCRAAAEWIGRQITPADRKWARRGWSSGSRCIFDRRKEICRQDDRSETARDEQSAAELSAAELAEMFRAGVTEFGSVKDADQFRVLRAYSPYHHVRDGARYPAILLLTGDNDHRVNPMQSRKMTAFIRAPEAVQPRRIASADGVPARQGGRDGEAEGSARPSDGGGVCARRGRVQQR
jgi:hypothetical protein